MNLIELLNQRTALRDQIALAVSEERIEDAHRMEGRVEMLDEQIAVVAAEQDAAMASAAPVATLRDFRPRNVAQAILGPQDEFRALGETSRLSIRNEQTGLVRIDDPVFEETSIPTWGESPFYGFADTLAKAVATGDVKYLRRKTRTNAAAPWTPAALASVQAKAESYFEWEKVTAQLELLAHWVPIERPTLARYGELEDVINNQLLIGLREVRDAKVLNGTNSSSGMVGILNTTGIQAYTAKRNDNIYDSIRRMITLGVKNSRMYPNAVAMAPDAKEALDLLKDDDGAYISVVLNGRVWNLPVIEDVNLIKDTTVDTTTTRHYGAVVYWTNAATLYTADDAVIYPGTINDQFVKNQLSLLAEESSALKVTYPDAFVYAQDIIASETLS